jgi:hypothetical protein
MYGDHGHQLVPPGDDGEKHTCMRYHTARTNGRDFLRLRRWMGSADLGSGSPVRYGRHEDIKYLSGADLRDGTRFARMTGRSIPLSYIIPLTITKDTIPLLAMGSADLRDFALRSHLTPPAGGRTLQCNCCPTTIPLHNNDRSLAGVSGMAITLNFSVRHDGMSIPLS